MRAMHASAHNKAITCSRNISRRIMYPLCRVPRMARSIDIDIDRYGRVHIDSGAGRGNGTAAGRTASETRQRP